MLRPSRFLAAALTTAALTMSAGADAHVVSGSFEMRFTVVATCSVNVDNTVQVACASPSTPFLLDAAAPSLRTSGPDAGRVTVYF